MKIEDLIEKYKGFVIPTGEGYGIPVNTPNESEITSQFIRDLRGLKQDGKDSNIIFEKKDWIKHEGEIRECLMTDDGMALFGLLYTDKDNDLAASCQDTVVLPNKKGVADGMEFEFVSAVDKDKLPDIEGLKNDSKTISSLSTEIKTNFGEELDKLKEIKRTAKQTANELGKLKELMKTNSFGIKDCNDEVLEAFRQWQREETNKEYYFKVKCYDEEVVAEKVDEISGR